MVLPLKHSRAIAEMADLLCDFLPGSGDPRWKGHVSFKTVAQKVGVGDFWQAGSKKPMIASLLGRTLEFKHDRFESLMLEIVRAGLVYRQTKNNPVKPGEIDYLNGLILEVGFKLPDLWDPDLKASLQVDGKSRAQERLKSEESQEKARIADLSERYREIHLLNDQFLAMHTDDDRQRVGFKFEKILNRLFALNQLSPREPFRVVGEQIDGSFMLDHEVYLFEAKWERKPSSEADLLVFRGKIEGKSKFTRGVFVSVNGITSDAEEAITRGKQPDFFVLNGYDITMLLKDDMDLSDFLRQRQRLLAEQGRICVPFNELQSQW
jgi:hypothetical protein